MQGVWLLIHQCFNSRKILGALPFYHVGRQRPRTAGKANQWHGSIKLMSNDADRLKDITQIILQLRYPQGINGILRINRSFETGAFAFIDAQTQPHCIRDSENV